MTSNPESQNYAKDGSRAGGRKLTASDTPKLISINGTTYTKEEMKLLPPGKVTEILLYSLIVRLEALKEQGEDMIDLGKKIARGCN